MDYLLRPVNARVLRSKVAVFVELWNQRKVIERKKVRNDEGYWERVESYITRRSGAQFSHGICATCEATVYPDEDEDGTT